MFSGFSGFHMGAALGLKKKEDEAAFQAFQSQDFTDVDKDLYTPSYALDTGGAKKKKQEEILSLFNARKDQVLEKRMTPGISQTRF